MKRFNKVDRKGFTLVEVLIVVSIIGLLATLMLVAYGNSLKKSRDNKRAADVMAIKQAAILYKDKNGKYPNLADARSNNSTQWNALNGLLNPYINVLAIKDPIQSTTYYYRYRRIYRNSREDCSITYTSEVTSAPPLYCND